MRMKFYVCSCGQVTDGCDFPPKVSSRPFSEMGALLEYLCPPSSPPHSHSYSPNAWWDGVRVRSDSA